MPDSLSESLKYHPDNSAFGSHKIEFKMGRRYFIFLVFAIIQTSQAKVFNPYSTGPHDHLFHRYTQRETGLDRTVDVWAPVESGPHPVIVYVGSYAGILPVNELAQTVLKRIASWGFAVIAPWKVSAVIEYHTNYIDPVVENLENRISNDWIAKGKIFL